MIDLPSMAPHSSGAEQTVLGAVLLDNAALLIARQILTPEDFYLRSHQMIFLTMLTLVDRGGVIDNLTLSEALLNKGVLKEIGGSAYLGELLLTVASAANIAHHARIVAEKSQIRKLRTSLRITLDAVESGASVAQVTAQIEQLQRSATESSAGIRAEPDRLLPGALAPLPVSQFLDEPEATQLTWIWDGFLTEGGFSAFVGKPKVGKTTVVYELAMKVAQGQPFLGRATRQSSVLILAVEEHPREIRRRIRALGAEDVDALHIHAGRLEDSAATLHGLRVYIAKHGIKLVVFDTLNSFWSVQEENDAVAVTQAIKPLLTLARESGASLLLLHHARKSDGEFGDEIRGSGALFSLLDVALILKRHEVDTQRKLTAISRYPETPPELIIELRDHGYECLGDPSTTRKVAKLNKLASALTEEPTEVKPLAHRAGVAVRSAYPLLDQLLLEGRAIRTGEGKRKSPFLYSLHTPRAGGPHETKPMNGHAATNPLTLAVDSFRASPSSKGHETKDTKPPFVSCNPHTPGMQRNGTNKGEPCYACKGTSRWISIHGQDECVTCHPPPSPDLVAEWIDGLQPGSAARC
jgi:replicative DNA helicase